MKYNAVLKTLLCLTLLLTKKKTQRAVMSTCRLLPSCNNPWQFSLNEGHFYYSVTLTMFGCRQTQFEAAPTVSAPLVAMRGRFSRFCSILHWLLHLSLPIVPVASSSIIDATQKVSEMHPTERPNSHEQGIVAWLVDAASGSCAI